MEFYVNKIANKLKRTLADYQISKGFFIWAHSVAVTTPGLDPGNTGSNPVALAKRTSSLIQIKHERK